MSGMWRVGALVSVLLVGCSDGALHGTGDGPEGPGADDTATSPDGPPAPEGCASDEFPSEDRAVGDSCQPQTGGFEPVTKWAWGAGGGCLSLPVVGDLDGDGTPEIVVNVTDTFSSPGDLAVLNGDSGALVFSIPASQLGLGFAASPALGDIDGDGSPEIVVVREHQSSLFLGPGDYTVVALSASGDVEWESDHFVGSQLDFQSSPILSDMDHDGEVEVIAGRVILRGADGTTRAAPQGSSSFMLPAVTDLDLDGVEELLGGDAWYSPDGELLHSDADLAGALVAVVNLDADPEGELVMTVGDSVQAVDTDGTHLWGPLLIAPGFLASIPTVGQLDDDPEPEIIVAGGNQLHCLNHDGTTRWTTAVSDETGATGASIFDFDGDGQAEVAYVDEVSMTVFDGATGQVRFATTEHSSNTMWDYPVIADVDADGSAEVVVCHNGFAFPTVSVFEDIQDRWGPARRVWNQHAYGITNIEDDLSVPIDAEPSFTASNTYHSAIATTGVGLEHDLEVEIVAVCGEHCDTLGWLWATVRVINRGLVEVPAGVAVSLYTPGGLIEGPVSTVMTDAPIPSGRTSAGIEVAIPASFLDGANWLQAVVDDDGTGGSIDECSEQNNIAGWEGALCVSR